MKLETLKIAVVGCGQIADAHLQEIRKTRIAEPVAVCDSYIDLARQAARRFEVAQAFENLEQMLDSARPDVLHVTTPPQTHLTIALLALARGVHVYVEKPFAIHAGEAAEMMAAAKNAGRLICVGHDQLFDPLWVEFQQRYDDGEFGRAVHIDSAQGYDLTGPFGKAFASDPAHWVHGLPGNFFQNTISHALYKITAFLHSVQPNVHAFWFEGGQIPDFPTELRVTLRGTETTAQLISSCACRPVQRLVRLYGTKQYAEIDFDRYWIQTRAKLAAPGALAKLEAPYRLVRQSTRALQRNVFRFARGELQYFGGMNRLFAAFYRAVRDGTPPPIAYEEILRVTAIMDKIFAACREGQVAGNTSSHVVGGHEQTETLCAATR